MFALTPCSPPPDSRRLAAQLGLCHSLGGRWLPGSSSSAVDRRATRRRRSPPDWAPSVTVVEREVIGGAAHLLDCIPSKTMIATGGAMSFLRRSTGMGLEQASATVDTEALTTRIEGIKTHLQTGTSGLLQ